MVVFQSADPEFFIAHADINLIMGLPAEPAQGTELGVFHAMVDRFRTMPKVTIGKLEGRARGGGSELLLGARSEIRVAREGACWRSPRSASASFPAAAERSDCRG